MWRGGSRTLSFSFSEIQFNQRHLCEGRQLFLGVDLSVVSVKGAVFEVLVELSLSSNNSAKNGGRRRESIEKQKI